MALSSPPAIEDAKVGAYRVPTDTPESDGTLEWDATTLVLVALRAGGVTGIGYSYADTATARLLHATLLPRLLRRNPLEIGHLGRDMLAALRNLGQGGIAAMAVSAADNALWDLKARLLGLSVAALLGPVRDSVPAYGSGGFTSYPLARLREQLGQWGQEGFRFVKMKVGRHPGDDLGRVDAARAALPDSVQLFVDANGAYSAKQALRFAGDFAGRGVTWLEEPLPSSDLDGLRLLREQGPAGLDISAGEYAYGPLDCLRLLRAGAVDVLQADATRCLGISGFMQAAALCEAFQLPLSSHCAPALHLHCCCAAARVRHLEYFYDHARLEHMLFEGAPTPRGGELALCWERPGFGLEFKYADARRFEV